MNIGARVSNTPSAHTVDVVADGRPQSLAIAPKAAGRGSSVNGGELLFAALATCFCNDLHREAAKRNVAIHRVDVEVTGTFGGPGEPAGDVEGIGEPSRWNTLRAPRVLQWWEGQATHTRPAGYGR